MANWDEYIEMLSKSKTATNIASSALKAVNILGEAGVPGAESLMEWVDDKAYKIGAQGASPIRSEAYIQDVTDDRIHDPEKRKWHGSDYTGIFDENQSFASVERTGELAGSKDDPNLLKIFLGIDENTLPESEYKPSSWTKGDPEQGWRSMKDYSSLEVTKPEDTILFAEGESNTRDEQIKNFVEHGYGDDIGGRVNNMRRAVDRGEYTPDMAVKGTSLPGLRYDTRVNVGHMTKSIGYDTEKEQYYMSVADVWDFDPEQYTEIWSQDRDESDADRMYTQASLMQAAGKPIGLYDRYYLEDSYMDDWYGKSSIEDNIVESSANYPELINLTEYK